MPPLYRLLSLRYLRRRWDRTALIVASIALGVATLVSTRVLNRCLETAALSASAPLAAGGDLLVSNGEPGVPLPLAAELRAANLPGVVSVTPLVVERVTLPDLANRPAVLVGAELDGGSTDGGPLGVAFVRTLPADLTSAALLLTRTPVVLSQQLHDAWTVARPAATAPLPVRFGSRLVACQPVGYFTVAADSPLAALGAGVIGMAVADAARLSRPGPTPGLAALVGGSAGDALFPPRVDRIDVRAVAGHDLAAVQDAVQGVVSGRGLVRPPDQHNRSTQEIVSGVQIGFTLCSFGAMVVGLFLVYNAMAVTVAERRADVGVLRSLGATRGQIIALFAVAAGVIGLVGAVAGVLLGAGLAQGVLFAFRDELGGLSVGAVGSSWPTLGTVVLGVLAGTGTAVVAGLIPALQAATQDPAEASRHSPRPVGGWWRVLHLAVISLLVGGGLAAILFRHHLPARVGNFGGVTTLMVGLILSAPVVVTLLVRFVHPLLRRVLPVEARLACDNLLRAPGRTGVVIGALAAGVGLMVQTAGLGRSNREPIVRWIDEVIRADRMVFAGSLTDAMGSAAPLEPRVAAEVAALPGVEGTFGVRYRSPEFNGTRIFLTALDARDYMALTNPRLPAGVTAYRPLALLPGSDGTVVSENFARRQGVGVGDVVELPGPRGPVRLTVLATMPDFSWSRGTLFLDRANYARQFQDDRLDVVHVFERDPSAAAAVEKYAADGGLVVQEREAMRRFIADLIDRVFLLAYLQQVVVALVAGLGIVTALLISVLQRKRELGLLLAVGATPLQVVKAVVWEAALLGVFGTLLGVAVGLPLEWFILRVVLLDESGFLLPVLVPWRAGLGIAAGSMLAATSAGLLPAWRAVKIRIPEAIQYE